MSRSTPRKTRRRKQIPDFPIRIEKLSHEGRGLARWGERILFVDGALPQELATVRVFGKSSRTAEAIAKDILVTSTLRAQPECIHASICGGCSLQHLPHHAQLEHKRQTLDELMNREGVPLKKVAHLPTLTSATLGYRRRARLGVRWVQAKDRLLIGFRERASNFIADIDACPILDPRIGLSLSKLEKAIASLSTPDRIPQIEVVAGDDTVAIVVRHLDSLTEGDYEHLSLLGKKTGWHIYLQPKGPDSVTRLWPSDGTQFLTYRIGEFGLEYQFAVTDFTQINGAVNRAMIIQAVELLDLRGSERVLDLFCGLGNFTLAAATRCAEVVGVEVSAMMIERVLQNARHNSLDNVRAVAFDLTHTVSDQSWANENYDILIIDPPRSGAKEVLKDLSLRQIDRVLYVSCNPTTLARDARILVDRGYSMTHLGMLDMFPHTAHIESMALFVKRGSRG